MGRRWNRPLVVGSGIAGLYVALRCRELGLRPTVITKSRLEESNTRYAQGGIAAAIGPDDSPAIHLSDTIRAGAGLVDRAAATLLTQEAPARIADLVRYGVPFDTVEGHVALAREAAHTRARLLHAGGDATGLSIEETLRRRVLEGGIDVRERTVLRALRAAGRNGPRAAFSDPDGRGVEYEEERPVVLASGGVGSLFLQSSNPAVATGEGVAIAFRAGAVLADLEFVQFHPTAFARPGAPRFLITEALRGEGAVLRNLAGKRFMLGVHPDAELAPRDVVARAIAREIAVSGRPYVHLDATGLPRDRLFARFPSVSNFVLAHGVDPSREPIPVSPVAHYMIGGVATDLAGRTSLPGLYAAGEVAATGVHGANRLGSNSLLEGLVFGEHVARQLAEPRPGAPRPSRTVLHLPLAPGAGRESDGEQVDAIRHGLWEDVGIVRSADGLAVALERFGRLSADHEPAEPDRLAGKVANAALTATLIARAAVTRTESRGAHYRSDFPRQKPAWKRHIQIVRQPSARPRSS